MCRYWGGNGWMRPIGIGLILVGALLIVWVIPPRLWAALLGVILIAAGAVLIRIG